MKICDHCGVSLEGKDVVCYLRTRHGGHAVNSISKMDTISEVCLNCASEVDSFFDKSRDVVHDVLEVMHDNVLKKERE